MLIDRRRQYIHLINDTFCQLISCNVLWFISKFMSNLAQPPPADGVKERSDETGTEEDTVQLYLPDCVVCMESTNPQLLHPNPIHKPNQQSQATNPPSCSSICQKFPWLFQWTILCDFYPNMHELDDTPFMRAFIVDTFPQYLPLPSHSFHPLPQSMLILPNPASMFTAGISWLHGFIFGLNLMTFPFTPAWCPPFIVFIFYLKTACFEDVLKLFLNVELILPCKDYFHNVEVWRLTTRIHTIFLLFRDISLKFFLCPCKNVGLLYSKNISYLEWYEIHILYKTSMYYYNIISCNGSLVFDLGQGVICINCCIFSLKSSRQISSPLVTWLWWARWKSTRKPWIICFPRQPSRTTSSTCVTSLA